MRNISIIIILCLLVIACNTAEKPKKPVNLISKVKMEQVLYDLYLINAAKGVNRKLLEANGLVPEAYILTKHQIDSAQFAKSNTYYAFNTEYYKSIIQKVKARLEKEKVAFVDRQTVEDKAEKKKRDSLYVIKTRKKDSIKKANREKRPDTLAI